MKGVTVSMEPKDTKISQGESPLSVCQTIVFLKQLELVTLQ